mmetsp:Transcript_77854/g.166949  ORF Transcript_77854/g.166949 Transcript_77854/m.166949 type:complete len:368 (-) Transcript_77854:2-1105(-)
MDERLPQRLVRRHLLSHVAKRRGERPDDHWGTPGATLVPNTTNDSTAAKGSPPASRQLKCPQGLRNALERVVGQRRLILLTLPGWRAWRGHLLVANQPCDTARPPRARRRRFRHRQHRRGTGACVQVQGHLHGERRGPFPHSAWPIGPSADHRTHDEGVAAASGSCQTEGRPATRPRHRLTATAAILYGILPQLLHHLEAADGVAQVCDGLGYCIPVEAPGEHYHALGLRQGHNLRNEAVRRRRHGRRCGPQGRHLMAEGVLCCVAPPGGRRTACLICGALALPLQVSGEGRRKAPRPAPHGGRAGHGRGCSLASGKAGTSLTWPPSRARSRPVKSSRGRGATQSPTHRTKCVWRPSAMLARRSYSA